MSIHRHAARADGNQDDIVEEFLAHGAHVYRLRKPVDLLVLLPHASPTLILVEVKNPDGRAGRNRTKPSGNTRVQVDFVKLWPVFEARTRADVRAILAGTKAAGLSSG